MAISINKNTLLITGGSGFIGSILFNGRSYQDLITYVSDRPGHDYRYAIDFSKIKNELGWKPGHSYHSGLKKTIRWYIDNKTWWQAIQEKKYNLARLGVRS